MFERRHEALLPRREYIRRVLRGFFTGLTIICGSLIIGMLGYHITEQQPWLDALVSAAMILFGEGPTEPVLTVAGKWFAVIYAAFSGVAFLTIVGVMFAPVVHRVFHKFHLEANAKAERKR